LTPDDDIGKKRAAGSRQPFRVEARPMGVRPGVGLSDVEGLLDQLDTQGPL